MAQFAIDVNKRISQLAADVRARNHQVEVHQQAIKSLESIIPQAHCVNCAQQLSDAVEMHRIRIMSLDADTATDSEMIAWLTGKVSQVQERQGDSRMKRRDYHPHIRLVWDSSRDGFTKKPDGPGVA